MINYKTQAMEEGSTVLDLERGGLAGIRALPWQTDTSISNKSWGYIENDTFKTPAFVIDQLADVVSKNGNLLLNVGPRADGTIPEPVQAVLHEVGAWLGVNGAAIYGTRPWRVYGEGPTRFSAGAFHDTDTQPYTAEDFRFTTAGDMLYAIELALPGSQQVVIRSLAGGVVGSQKVRSVALLGLSAPPTYLQKSDGLHITVPAGAPGKYALCFEIGFE